MRRPVLPVDVITFARALFALPAASRERRAARILSGALRAEHHRRAFGRLHPRWGDGSLDAAARRYPLAAEPFWDDLEFLACLRLALRTVAGEIEASIRVAQPKPETKNPRARSGLGGTGSFD